MALDLWKLPPVPTPPHKPTPPRQSRAARSPGSASSDYSEQQADRVWANVLKILDEHTPGTRDFNPIVLRAAKLWGGVSGDFDQLRREIERHSTADTLDHNLETARDFYAKGQLEPLDKDEPQSGKKRRAKSAPRQDGDPAEVLHLVPRAAGGWLQRADGVELADLLRHRLNDEGFTTSSEGRFWRYQGGFFKAVPEADLLHIVSSFSGLPYGNEEPPRCVKLEEPRIRGIIKLALAVNDEPGFFDEDASVTFSNCTLAFGPGGLEIREHSPENRSRLRVEFDYKPDEEPDCPKWLALLASDFDDCLPPEAAARTKLLQEFMGAALFGLGPRFQKALAIYCGEGSTGKSAVLNVIRAMFPREMVSAINPGQLAEKFGASGLVGVRVNLVPEIKKGLGQGADDGVLKAIITGDAIKAEQKFKDPFWFKPRATHIFTGNYLPSSADLSSAYFRRFAILLMTRARPEGGADTKDDVETEITATEIPAIVAWAVEGAVRRWQRGCYTVTPDGKARAEQWRREADTVAVFLDEETEPVGETYATPLYDAYLEWGKRAGVRHPVTRRTFGQRLFTLLGTKPKDDRRGHLWPVGLLVAPRY